MKLQEAAGKWEGLGIVINIAWMRTRQRRTENVEKLKPPRKAEVKAFQAEVKAFPASDSGQTARVRGE